MLWDIDSNTRRDNLLHCKSLWDMFMLLGDATGKQESKVCGTQWWMSDCVTRRLSMPDKCWQSSCLIWLVCASGSGPPCSAAGQLILESADSIAARMLAETGCTSYKLTYGDRSSDWLFMLNVCMWHIHKKPPTIDLHSSCLPQSSGFCLHSCWYSHHVRHTFHSDSLLFCSFFSSTLRNVLSDTRWAPLYMV
jgi:hypothetical protein